MSTAFPAYPAEREVFELTLDGDDPNNDPIVMAQRDGYEFTHVGKKVVGVQTGRFMLVRSGYRPYFDELRQSIETFGAIPEGQWREAFKAKFPHPHGKQRPVAVADASWRGSADTAYYPWIDRRGKSGFHGTEYDLSEEWFWLVRLS